MPFGAVLVVLFAGCKTKTITWNWLKSSVELKGMAKVFMILYMVITCYTFHITFGYLMHCIVFKNIDGAPLNAHFKTPQEDSVVCPLLWIEFSTCIVIPTWKLNIAHFKNRRYVRLCSVTASPMWDVKGLPNIEDVGVGVGVWMVKTNLVRFQM